MEPVAAGTNEPDGLFALPEGARVVRRRRSPARRSRPEVTYVPVPDPVLVPQRSVAAPVGPPLSGMEEVGTGLLDRLDMMQRVAASAPPGPLLVNAGPGTGKTHTLTHRIAYLIADLDVPARECVAVTRDARAAAELRTRLAALLGERADDVMVAPLDALAGAEPWRHVFVDDLHDFTAEEYEVLRGLGGDGEFVSATGDADQTLTEGQPDLLERFTTEHTDTRVFRLTRNYRSLETILATAGLLVSPVAVARSRLLQPVRREAVATPPVQRYAAADEAEEAGVVADVVTRLSRLGVPAAEIGVLWLGEPRPVSGASSLRLGAAVGREFRVVIVPGADADALPVDTANRRRLFVALTRARDLVYLTHVGTPSPLLAEMHSGLVRVFGHVPDEVAAVEQPRLL